jgi:hypothetical protein
MSPGPMAGDAHLHNAAATLRDILTRRQPEYRWDVEVLPRRDAPIDNDSSGPADQPVSEGPTAAPALAPRTTAPKARPPSLAWEPQCYGLRLLTWEPQCYGMRLLGFSLACARANGSIRSGPEHGTPCKCVPRLLGLW